MSKIVDKIAKMSEILDKIGHISKKSKIQKSVPQIFRYHIEVPLDQIQCTSFLFEVKIRNRVISKKKFFVKNS